ncbi:hypothetical protein GX645_04540 [Candidatus Sumerlaeota bacterium]|nr:hypothetical protein [Candidatus Sumerlaeales bacterium]NLD61699.1 hypothetical protein [Candidatus Sumerlaeota bacterium]
MKEIEKDLGFCYKHPDIPASAECRECGAPICKSCTIHGPEGKGDFCSTTCRDSFYEYQQWLSENAPNPFEHRFSLWAWIKHLSTLFILLAIIWGALYVMTGELTPTAQFRSIFDLIRALF